jgi:iron complex outermembrane receptor protein
VIRSCPVVAASVLLILGSLGPGVEAQDPDSVVAIEPILVRVLGSTIGTKAPYPVSVVAGPELTRGTASSFIEEALRAVPGLQIHNRFNFAVGERIAIRGFGARSQFGVRGVRVLVDGIPATLPDGQATLDHLDLAGLGRVEVLRGPNAALYGNAAGGVLHFRTTDPALVPASVSLRTTAGDFGMLSIEGNATGTAGNAGYRVGYTNMNYDGFRRDPVADDGTAYGAASRSTLNATVSFPVGNGTLRVVGNGMSLDAENPGSLPQRTLEEGQRSAWGFNVRSGAIKDVTQGQLGASWTGNLGESTTAEFATWGITRDLYNPIPGRVIDLSRSAGGIRSLFQGAMPLGDRASFGWGAGFEAEMQNDDRLNYGNDAGQPDFADVRLDQNERVRGSGIFVQARLDAGSNVSILTGLRYDNINFSVDDNLVDGDPDDSGERSMGALSPSVGVVIAVGDEAEIFGSLGRSFETPTTTELANQPSGAGGFNPGLEPQSGVTVEGGVRTVVANHVSLEGSIFQTKIKDGLVPFDVPSDPGRTYYRNAARAKHFGWEIAADASLVQDLTLRVAYTNIDATYEFYETDDDVFSGNKIPGLAPQRFDAVLLFDRGVGFIELRGLWQDGLVVRDDGSAYSPAYFITDARVGLYGLVVGQFNLDPFIGVANMLDATYNSSVVPNAFGSRYFEPGPTRTYRVGLGITWGR